MFEFQTDKVIERLQVMAIADSMLGDDLRVEVLRAMIEAYMHGYIDVAFDVEGEPVATMIEYSVPVVRNPWEIMPRDANVEDEADTSIKNQIGFKVN